MIRKLILQNFQSPGDIIMMSYAIKALHEQYPEQYLTDVRTPCKEIFEGNPYVTPLDPKDPDVKILKMDYPNIHKSNQNAVQFVNAFIDDLANKLEIKLDPIQWDGAIWIRDEEKQWWSQIHEILGYDPPFWIINAGHKWDYTAKAWDFERYQKIVDTFPDLWFVQVGLKEHNHPPLKGENLINLIGKTDTRQMIRLVWHSYGVITPISFPMHLAYAVPPHPRYNRKSRACIVIAGGREPNHWQAAANQQFVHTCGMLDCCDYGGSWKSRVVPINDGDKKDKDLCLHPVKLKTGQCIAKCMDMITAEEICLLVKKYMDNLPYPLKPDAQVNQTNKNKIPFIKKPPLKFVDKHEKITPAILHNNGGENEKRKTK